MQDEMEIMDRDDPDAIRYPTVKHEGETGALERKVTILTRDINIPGVHETVYFPLNFCMEDAVIDAVAQKYEAGAENYPDNEDDEHFLIGTAAFRMERFKLNCPYMNKANIKIAIAENVDFSDGFAVYLLGLDDSNDNRQKLLVMTKKKLCILHDTQAFQTFSYSDIRFTPDGIFDRYAEENLLDYNFEERFLNFAHEFMLLRCTTLVDVRERHPLACAIDDSANPDMVADMKLDVAEIETRPVMGRRNAYLRFLVDTAAAEGFLEAQTMLRLCYMAREFRVSADSMLSWIKQASRGGIRKNKLQTELTRILDFIGVKYKFVFLQDLLEVGTDSEGNFHRQELLKILKRKQFDAEKFLEHYLEYVGARHRAERELQNAFQNLQNQKNDFKGAVRAQNYISRMNLQLVSMEAMLNEQ